MHNVVIFDILLKSFEAIVDMISWPIDLLVDLLWLNHLDLLTITGISVGSVSQELFVLCYQIFQDTLWSFRRPWVNGEDF